MARAFDQRAAAPFHHGQVGVASQLQGVVLEAVHLGDKALGAVLSAHEYGHQELMPHAARVGAHRRLAPSAQYLQKGPFGGDLVAGGRVFDMLQDALHPLVIGPYLDSQRSLPRRRYEPLRR